MIKIVAIINGGNSNVLPIMTTVTNANNEYKKDTEEHFVFTRYLYEKEEVEIALLLNILHKKEDESLFWAYELHYSGFTDKLIQLLWKIYYEFFSTLNVSFENYLLNKLNCELFANEPKSIASVINNFLIRPFNTDVFVLTQLDVPIGVKYSNNFATLKKQFVSFLENHDYTNIGLYMLRMFKNEKLDEIVSVSIKYFSKFIANLNIKKIVTKLDTVVEKNNYNKPVVILVKILHYYSILSDLKLGKNIYVICDENDVTNYQTIHSKLTCCADKPYAKQLPAYKILGKANLYSIDSLKCLKLFSLKRDNYDIVDAYLNHWLYYAAFSPIWKTNIQKYNGTINHETKSVVFDNEENEELFYDNYNYEPDEQTKEIQDKHLLIEENTNLEMILFDNNFSNCLIENT